MESGEIKRRAMKQKEPLDPVREMLGYGVFVVVILGLMTGILPAWEVTMIGARGSGHWRAHRAGSH